MSTPDSSTSPGSAKFPTLARVSPAACRWCLRAAVVGFGLAILYVLSIGPAVQLNKRGVISPETFEQLYFPLSLFSDIPGSQWLIDRYMRLWADPGPGNE